MKFPQQTVQKHAGGSASETPLLFLLLAAFFLKGVFLATLFPIFTGQDEARHYNSIQYLNEPNDRTWEKNDRKHLDKKNNFLDYNFSEEILFTGQASGIDDIRNGLYNTIDFSETSEGKNEQEILKREWQPRNFFENPDIVRGSLYHTIASKIEMLFARYDILVRFYLLRIFSVLLGTFAVLFSFLIARTVGFDRISSLLFAGLVAFQPKFSMYTTNINYDALFIPLFFLFTWSGTLALRDGLNWKNASIMLFALALGLLTKGTAIVLLVAFLGIIGYTLFGKLAHSKKLAISGIFFLTILFAAYSVLETRYPLSRLLPLKGSPTEIVFSLGDYLQESLTLGRFALSSRTYWGTLDWNRSALTSHFTDFLWPIEAVATIGLILLLFSRNKPRFLPEKKFIVFLMGMILALQFGIRLADWNVFAATGSLDLGTPGRYFLPNLATHLILVFAGFGMILGRYSFFRNTLLSGAILMFFFYWHVVLDVILPRFYL